MSDPTRYVSGLVLVLCCVGFPSLTNAQLPTKKDVPLGAISGRVTIEENGARGIVVSIRPREFVPGPSFSSKATTDEDGNYRISKIPAGHYSVLPLSLAFVLPEGDLASQRGRPLVIAEGEEISGIDFTLESGGVITGKVCDQEGRPLVEERVRLVATESANSGPVYRTDSLTDDRGVYRIFGVRAGSYRVSVGEEASAIYSRAAFMRRPVSRTFHPDKSEESEAAIVEVKEGEEISNIDITVAAIIPSFSVSGRVVDGDSGRPIPGARLRIGKITDRGRNTSLASVANPANANGEFQVDGVTNGTYSISFATPPGVNLLSEDVHFEVRDQPVTGLVVKTSQGASVSGSVVLEGTADRAVREKLQQIILGVFVRREGIMLPVGSSTNVKADGSFQVVGLRDGTLGISLHIPNLMSAQSFSIIRIEKDGVVQPRGIIIEPGEHITGLRIVVGHGTGAVRGVVTFENGTLPPGSRVFLSLRRVEDGTPVNIRTPEVDSRGHFAIGGLRAGAYELIVRANVPAWRSRQPIAVQQILVNDGNVTEIAVSLDLTPNSDQTP